MCAPCLARQIAAPKTPVKRRFGARLRELGSLAAALLIVWFTFYQFGRTLLRIPTDVHDGTVWKRAGFAPEDTSPSDSSSDNDESSD